MDSLFSEEISCIEWLNMNLRDVSTAEQDLSALAIKLQLIEQDLELNLDYQSYSILTTMQSLRSEADTIYKQTLELLEEEETIEKVLKAVLTPEIDLLQRDHGLLSIIDQSKTSLKEIEHIDAKIAKAKAAMSENLIEAADLIKNIYQSFQIIKSIPQYSSQCENILELIQSFENQLRTSCVQAGTDRDGPELKKLAYACNSIEKNNEFKETLFKARRESLPQSFEGDLVAQFNSIKSVLEAEIKLFKDVLYDPNDAIDTIVSIYLSKIQFEDIETVSIQDVILVHQEFTEFAKFLKLNYCSLKATEGFVVNLLQISDEKYFQKLERNSIRPISLESWSSDTRLLLSELEKSWDRSLVFTFGTCGFAWSRMAEEQLCTKFKQINEYYSQIANFFTELMPESERTDSNFKFNWDNANKFAKIYEEITLVYEIIEKMSENCRNSFLQAMTTSYFSPQLEIQKDLQEIIFKQTPELLKKNLSFTSFLREGGNFFAKSLEIVEKDLEICKNIVEKLFKTSGNS